MSEEKKKINIPEVDLPTKPLTPQEIREAAQKRISAINKEFEDGFRFLESYPKSVTVFGSARFKEDNPHYQKSRSLARKISEELGYAVITGGGPGIMEAANRGAYEADGKSLGLTIELPKEQAVNPYVKDSVDFYYFFVRKVCLAFAAEAYIFFPGGFGTLDEFFEIITLVQTNKIQPVPVILIGNEYWGALDKFLREQLLERGTISEIDVELYSIREDEDEIVNIIKRIPPRSA